ncbi:DUF6089 family protein [Botryobacter ruber]|uniref:DUF6089 family protein n=1 Tax=Botryobacter ruber TaxID=2171629 RepID=UPI000E0BB258|nr:DUF6089 family protein [Botryobacter ruber]
MKNITTLISLFVLILLIGVLDAEAQRFTRRQKYNSVGVSVNASNYFGDITPQPDFTSLASNATRPSVGINFTRRLHPRVSGRVGFMWARIAGDDAKSASQNEAENFGRYRRNLSFRNDVKELSAVAIVDLFENRRSPRLRPDFVPYAFAGVALLHHNPKAYYENGDHGRAVGGIADEFDIPTGWYALQPLGTEGQYTNADGAPDPYKRVQIAIPFGLGVRYKLGRFWDLSLEVGWRKTFTDYLDDVSTAYVNKDAIRTGGGANPTAAALLSDRSGEGPFVNEYRVTPNGAPYYSIPGYGTPENQTRGHRTDDDWYITTGLTLSYILNNAPRRPKFR